MAMTEFRKGDLVSLQAYVEDVGDLGVLVRITALCAMVRAFRADADSLTLVRPRFNSGDAVWDGYEGGIVLATSDDNVWVRMDNSGMVTRPASSLTREQPPFPTMTEQELADGIAALTPVTPPADIDQGEIPF